MIVLFIPEIMRIDGSGSPKAEVAQPLEASTGSIYPWITCLGIHQKFQTILSEILICDYSILLAKISSRFSASQKRMGTWLCTIATLFGKDFLIIPLRLWNPVWVNMVKLSSFCRQKLVAHCTYAKKGTFVMSLLEALFWANSHKMGPVTSYKY